MSSNSPKKSLHRWSSYECSILAKGEKCFKMLAFSRCFVSSLGECSKPLLLVEWGEVLILLLFVSWPCALLWRSLVNVCMMIVVFYWLRCLFEEILQWQRNIELMAKNVLKTVKSGQSRNNEVEAGKKLFEACNLRSEMKNFFEKRKIPIRDNQLKI